MIRQVGEGIEKIVNRLIQAAARGQFAERGFHRLERVIFLRYLCER